LILKSLQVTYLSFWLIISNRIIFILAFINWIMKKYFDNSFYEGYANNKVYLKATSLLPQDKNLKILDLACGKGNFTKILIEKGYKNVSACDLFTNQFLIPSIKCKKCNLNKEIPSPSNSFDIVIALEIIEHLENPRNLIREISRILKKGGTCVMSTPNISSLRSRLSFLFRGYFGYFSDNLYPMHITPCSKKDLMRIFSENNFKTEYVTFTDSERIPKLNLNWQSLFPFLKGEFFSENILVVARKIK